MLTITVPKHQLWDESKEEFLLVPEQVLQLEHSLISLSKWESVWMIPFLSPGKKPMDQTIDYIKHMTINKCVDPLVYVGMTDEILEVITKYIEAPMTATTFGWEPKQKGVPETITAELIRYWMIAFSIPAEYEKWHLNRLLTLIRVCNVKNAPDEKVNASDMAAQRRKMNADRKRKYGTKG